MLFSSYRLRNTEVYTSSLEVSDPIACAGMDTGFLLGGALIIRTRAEHARKI